VNKPESAPKPTSEAKKKKLKAVIAEKEVSIQNSELSIIHFVRSL